MAALTADAAPVTRSMLVRALLVQLSVLLQFPLALAFT
jgi:hypothetical protein